MGKKPGTYIHTQKYYMSLKGNKILIFAVARRNHEDIILTDIGQVPKIIVWFHLHEVFRKAKFIEIESKIKMVS